MVHNSEAVEQGDAADAGGVACTPRGRDAADAPFPRPRGRGPPGCSWDVLKGGWFRADGSAWQKVRNEKRELARAAQRAERRAKKEEEEEREKYFSAKVTKQRLEPLMQRIALERKERLQEERLERKRLKCEARQAAIAARDARARLVRFDGNTVYCAKHLHELDVVGWDGERCITHAKCGACVELGWRDVRRASPPELFAHASPKLTSIRARAGASSSRTGALSARTSRTASSA